MVNYTGQPVDSIASTGDVVATAAWPDTQAAVAAVTKFAQTADVGKKTTAARV